mgnify:CR=1 FL=1
MFLSSLVTASVLPFYLSGKLTVKQLGICSVFVQQFFMCSLFDDIALFHDKDQIRINDRGQTMGNDKACLSFHQQMHRMVDMLLTDRIDAAGCLIKDQYTRIHQQDTGDREQLPLTLRKDTAVAVQNRIVSFVETNDKLMGPAFLCGGNDRFTGSIRLSVGDIFRNRPFKQIRILQYHAERRTQRVSCHCVDIMAVNSDTAAADVIKTHQQIDQCCFAGSGLSYDRHLAAGFDMQIDIFHQRLLRIISERYMFEIDFPFFEVQHIFIAVIALFFQIHDRKDTFTAGHRALQLCHDTGDFRKRLRKQIRVDQKSGNVTDRDLGEKGKQGTDRTDDGIRCIHDKARARIRQRTVKLRFYTGGIQLLIIRFKLPLSIFFISVCFRI